MSVNSFFASAETKRIVTPRKKVESESEPVEAGVRSEREEEELEEIDAVEEDDERDRAGEWDEMAGEGGTLLDTGLLN